MILFIFGVAIAGCISKEKAGNSVVNYHSTDKSPNFELQINGADDYSKQKILTAINHTDQNVIKYISSINVVSRIEDSECNDDNITGCAIANFTVDNKLKDIRLYVLDRDAYKGTCNVFENILYHEIGHAVYYYKFGDFDVNRSDKIYQDSLELYAIKYADIYVKTDKEGCDEEIIKQLEKTLNEKDAVYQFAVKVVSKWDIYKDGGIPKDMYDQYLYDYDIYKDAKKEYTDALEKFRSYIKKSQE